MKLSSLFIAVALVFSVSCASHKKKESQYDTVPLVQNRDANGRFISPLCPVCGEHPAGSGSYYICKHEHVFATQLKTR